MSPSTVSQDVIPVRKAQIAAPYEPGALLPHWTGSSNGSRMPAAEQLVVHLPDPDVAQQFMDRYNETKRDAALAWSSLEEQQEQVDDIVLDWYGLSETLRAEVRQGLPWARRTQPA